VTEKEKLVRYLRDMADSLAHGQVNGWWANAQRPQIEVPPTDDGWKRYAPSPVASIVILWW